MKTLWIVLLGVGFGAFLTPLEGYAQKAPPVDPQARIAFQYGPNMRFGISVLKEAGNAVQKKLTNSTTGETNNTIVRLAGKDLEYGGKAGKWTQKNVIVPADKARQTQGGSVSTWEAGDIRISQYVELVASRQPENSEAEASMQRRPIDTCLVRYVIENQGNAAEKVGLRFLLDTYVGGEDGVPFYAVGRLGGLVNESRSYNKPNEVPEFALALENSDLKKPGIVSNLTFNVGSLEPPGSVGFTEYPKKNALAWTIPIGGFKATGDDSAVVMYWPERDLHANERRTLGFTYGLATLSVGGDGRFGIVLGGTSEVNPPPRRFQNTNPSSLTVAAFVANPVKGETLTLNLPAGLGLGPRLGAQPVTPLKAGHAGNNIVVWNVEAERPGAFSLQFRSSLGARFSRTAMVHDKEADGK